MREMLDQYLERIIAITVSTEMDLLPNPPQDTTRLEYGRMRMARILTAYQLFVHRELFQPLQASGDAAEVECARQLKAECGALAESVRTHTRTWSTQEPAAMWDEYRSIELGLIESIRQHILRVRAAVERLDGDAIPTDLLHAETSSPAASEPFLRQMTRSLL